ncbi:hypothetical protein V3W47_14085 [Deinococcus sp. YIM 134068]|uniref:hypothetical protein n=1 Tax=Deinococcus lichenicola TaxID=3118910 RepID=UPI002F93FD33
MPEQEVNPTVAFLRLKRFLDKVDTADTLGMLSLLTWHEMHHIRDPNLDVLYPFANAPVLQYVTQAALLAGSDQGRSPRLSGDGICQAVQLGHDVLSPPHLPGDVISKMSLQSLTTDLFAPMLRHQGRLQNPDFFWSAAQQWQLFNVIPHRDAALLAKRAGGQYLDIPAEVGKRTGLPIEDVYAVACAVYSMNMAGTRALSQELQATPNFAAPHERLLWFVDQARREGRPMGAFFTVQDLQRVLKDETPHRARVWLNTFSAPPLMLKRRTEEERRYNSGELTFQVLPLEATPVVRLRGGRFIVPNAHSFVAGLPHLPELHAMLNWPRPEQNRLRTTLGYIQETYLEEFVGQALAGSATLIPEREYRRPSTGNPARGPDLTVVEPTSRSAVLVESKAMLFADEARVGAGIEPFANVDDRMSEVVLKADWKAADLLDARVGTYDPFRADLSVVDPSRVVTVIVHAEHLHGYNVTWRARRRSEGHVLHGHTPNFIALSLEEFARFADGARQSGRSLHDLLREQIDVIELQDIGFDQSVLEGLGNIDEESVWRKQLMTFMDSVEAQWLKAKS